MGEKTKIRWSDATWNAVWGCSKVSPGCAHCYAERFSVDGRGLYSKKPWTPENAKENVTLLPHRLREPYKWKQAKRVFVNSFSDCFHELIPDEYIAQMFQVMNDLPRHQFQILTKRPERAATWPGPWGPNIWMGTSIENKAFIKRADSIRKSGAAIKFISAEPLLGPLSGLDLTGIHWLIVGGESGPHLAQGKSHERWMKQEWARELRDMCVANGTAYFYKQDSGIRTELRTKLVEEDGSLTTWEQYPRYPGDGLDDPDQEELQLS